MSELGTERDRTQAPAAIVGLGNPGPRYARTRHNVGFMLVDALAREFDGREWRSCCQALICEGHWRSRRVLLTKPMTYMNLSGNSVRLLFSEFNLSSRDVLLVFDDLSLPLGRVRLREKGAAAGHRGLESVQRTLQTDEILRLRLGIGEQDMPADKAEFVLSEFPPEREPDVEDMIRRAASAVKMILDDGVPKAMSVFNAKQ